MKTMKLLPLKIAVTSALIVGLGTASTANAQAQNNNSVVDIDSIQKKLEEINKKSTLDTNDKFKILALSLQGNAAIVDELNKNVEKNKTDIRNLDEDRNFLSQDITELYDVAHNQQDAIKGLKKKAKGLKKEVKDLNKEVKELDKEMNVLSRDIVSLNDDVAQNNESIEDLYDFSQEVAESIGEIHAHNKAQNETLKELITNSVKNTDNITKNKADIQALENNVVEELFNLSGRLIDQKADLTKDIKTLESNVEEGLLELSGHLIDQKADIAKNQADIAQNQANIQDLAAYNELQDAYAKQQTEAIDALNKASSENTQNIEDLAAYNELQDAYAKQQTEAIDALNKASSENTQNIAKNQADIANNINNIYELAQQQDQHSSDIKTLAKASAANTDRIAKNKADADASFETLTKNQNTLIEKDKEHDKLITANKTAIDANKASADTKFAATADAITKNGNAITKNAKSITDLGTKVDAFDGRVTALDTKVNAFDGRITALDSKVENGMAAQAALSGLFQPYSVGKFNATAALGGYGSKSAVAIGAGYRVNPNLAFKAGAAINTSGNKKGSYNIGVNYEF